MTDKMIYLNTSMPEYATNLATFAAKISLYNFEWRYVTLVVYTAHVIGVETFTKVYNNSVVLKEVLLVPKHRYAVSQFVVFADDTDTVTRIVQWLVSAGYDNTGTFILICTSMDNKGCNEKELTKVCRHLHVVNVVILKKSETSDQPQAFTYQPVAEGNCMNHRPELMHMSAGCPFDKCFKNIYPDKMLNMRGCPIVVSTFEQRPFMYFQDGIPPPWGREGDLTQLNLLKESKPPLGSDGELLNLIIQLMNASLRIITPRGGNWGHRENGNWTGSVGDVFHDRAHLSMCSAPITYNKSTDFHMSVTYDSMEMVWVASLPPLKPAWQKLIYPFKLSVWIMLMVMFTIIVVINTLLKTSSWTIFQKIVNIAPIKSNVIFYSWKTFMGEPLLRIPSKPALKSMIFSWIWFSFILRTVYQAALFDSLKQRSAEDNLETFDDVLRHQLPFGGLASIREFYTEDPHIYNEWRVITLKEMYPMLDKMSNHSTDFVMAANRETVIEYLVYYNGTRKIQIIPEKIVNSPTVLYFKKYSPLRLPISEVLCVTVEAGFTERLYHRFVSKKHMFFGKKTTKEQEQSPLSFEHFAGSFAILTSGFLLSFVGFLWELTYGNVLRVIKRNETVE